MWMKNQEEFKDIPVLMMSTDEEVKKLYYCIDMGAVDYLVKPIRLNVSLLKSAIAAIFNSLGACLTAIESAIFG